MTCIALAQAQQAVIDEHAGELRRRSPAAAAPRPPRNRRRRTGRAAPARRRPARARARQVLDDVAGGPARLAAADLAHEALENRRCPGACASPPGETARRRNAGCSSAMAAIRRIVRCWRARVKPGGSASTRSPWLIQTSSTARPSCCRSRMPSSSRLGAADLHLGVAELAHVACRQRGRRAAAPWSACRSRCRAPARRARTRPAAPAAAPRR